MLRWLMLSPSFALTFFKNLTTPTCPIDMVLDTDAFNEIDDQFAISYMIRHGEKLNVKGICAAPFYNFHSSSPEDGMEKSYNEIFKLFKIAYLKTKLNLNRKLSTSDLFDK